MEKELIENINKVPFLSTKLEKIEKLLKEEKKSGTYRFEVFQTEFGQTVTPENYHQVCRYCIEEKDKETVHMEKYDDTLNKITEWLKEVI